MSGRRYGRLRLASIALAVLAVGILGAHVGEDFQSAGIEWGAPPATAFRFRVERSQPPVGDPVANTARTMTGQ